MKTTAATIQRHSGKILSALALTLILASSLAVVPAQADPHGPYDHPHDRDWHHDHWHHGPHYVYEAPQPVYAPPVVYSAPPEPFGLNLIVPLHIR